MKGLSHLCCWLHWSGWLECYGTFEPFIIFLQKATHWIPRAREFKEKHSFSLQGEMLSLRWSWVDGWVQLVFLCWVISPTDKLVRCEQAEWELRRAFDGAETAGKLTSCCLTEGFTERLSAFKDRAWSESERGRVGSVDPEQIVPLAQVPVEWGRGVSVGRLRYLVGLNWLFLRVKCSAEPAMRLFSFLFLLNMSSCSWFHDLTKIDSSLSSLWHFKFSSRSSKEFCFDKLFQISCSKYLNVAFRFTSFIPAACFLQAMFR